MSTKTHTRKAHTTGSTPTLRSVPDPVSVARVRTDAEDKLWAALHAYPNRTAADLADTAKIGKSTAQKFLVKWADDGSVTRTTGIAKGGRRAADLWAITEADTARADTDDAPAGNPDVADTAQAGPIAPVGPNATDTEDAQPADGDPTEPTSTEPTDATAHTSDTTGTGTTGLPEAGPVIAEPTQPVGDGVVVSDADTEPNGGGEKARLAPGALRGMVEDYLRDHPGEEFGPTSIAKALEGKSSGAVSNALDKLVEEGTVVKTKESPRRFALAPAERATAQVSSN
ncbi:MULTISPECIES: MarR family transcriptional regulator [Saccharothrix]|uniref:MarR family transcriptional regulator n=1 Tax=Saccharothrix TaxID=2071 RepID=UPI00093F7025|nr:MarR family transcriptional regulator [Saccharothrix sp. CB00851]OKI24703.1 hypothetical protein A6A25_34415 [Saccharothrix sp. CB00851]